MATALGGHWGGKERNGKIGKRVKIDDKGINWAMEIWEGLGIGRKGGLPGPTRDTIRKCGHGISHMV